MLTRATGNENNLCYLHDIWFVRWFHSLLHQAKPVNSPEERLSSDIFHLAVSTQTLQWILLQKLKRTRNN